MPYYGGGMGVQKLGGFPGPGQLSTDVIKANIPAPYSGNGMGVQQLRGFAGPGQLSTDVIEANLPNASFVAGGPSFDINAGSAGDARRKRKGLSPQDVQRLIEANPQFEKQIKDMYLPGAQGTPFFKQAGLPTGFDAKYVS
jgi:hypothetical protein